MVSLNSDTMLELFPDLAELQNNVSRSRSVSVSETSDKSSVEELLFEDELDLVNYLSGNAIGSGSNKDGGVSDGALRPSGGINAGRPQRVTVVDGQCMTKNAVAARENRLKKKQYINTLETTVRELSNENISLKTKMVGLEKSVSSLRDEVKYLRSVLANESTLSALLKNIPLTSGVQLQSSELNNNIDTVKTSRKRKLVAISHPLKKSCVTVAQDIASISDDCVSMTKLPKTDHSYATCMSSQHVDWEESSDVEIEVELEDLEVESSPKSLSPGVCLHVAGNRVSLEFCQDCSQKAAGETPQDR